MQRFLKTAKAVVGRGLVQQELELFEKWYLSQPQRRWAMRYRAWRGVPHDPILLDRPMDEMEKGFFGECLVARELKRLGRRVLYRNYSAPHGGEVDIVCRHGDALTFVEVKTRTSMAFGRPADAVGADKQKLIQRGAADWLKRLQFPPLKLRFDIAEVLLVPGQPPDINIIENAFPLPDGSLLGRTARYE